jgi:hypothetical protein
MNLIYEQIIIDIISEIPLGKQKYHFVNYEDVFSGASLLNGLKLRAHRISPVWEQGISNDQALELAKNLFAR